MALATHGVNNAQAVKAGAVWSQVSGADADRHAAMRMILELEQISWPAQRNVLLRRTSCRPRTHPRGRSCARWSSICFRSRTSAGDHRRCIARRPAGAAGFQRAAREHSPTICGRTSTTRNRIRWSAACTISHGPRTGRNRTSTDWSRTSAAVRLTFTRDGQSSPIVCSCFAERATTTRRIGLVATAYAPCEVRTSLRGTAVHVVEETNYPFRGTVQISVNPAHRLSFPLLLRIPAWADRDNHPVNGQSMPAPAPNSFARIERTWTRRRQSEIVFPMPRESRDGSTIPLPSIEDRWSSPTASVRTG